MSSSSPLRRSLRRLKPDKHLSQLHPRLRSSLTFVESLTSPPGDVLLDTTVYIDELQGRLPRSVEAVLRASQLWHSTVTEAELAAILGILDPRHKDTSSVNRQVQALLQGRPSHRTLNPDEDVWREAGILAGLLARLQGYGKSERRRTLNDALIFLSAAKQGCTVLTRNVADFDLLLQLAPFGKVLFYNIV